MTYRVGFGGDADIQYHSLPLGAQDAFVFRAADLADAPWDGATVLPPGDDTAYRQATFDGEMGLLEFRIDESAQTLQIFRITWVGPLV